MRGTDLDLYCHLDPDPGLTGELTEYALLFSRMAIEKPQKKLFIRLWALGTKTSHNSGLGGGSNKKNTSDPYHGHGSIKFILNITVSKKVISV